MIEGSLIRTKFLGPTNYRGSRISASHQRDGEVTWRKVIEWDHAKDGRANAEAAAEALIESCPMAEWQARLVATGWDHDHYYFLAAAPHQ